MLTTKQVNMRMHEMQRTEDTVIHRRDTIKKRVSVKRASHSSKCTEVQMSRQATESHLEVKCIIGGYVYPRMSGQR